MFAERLPVNDPRTLARDVLGLSDVLFPQLVPGIVAHFNRRRSASPNCMAVPQALVTATTLQRAMLFELAVAVAEQLLMGGSSVDWQTCLAVAVSRQRRHFDAQVPASLAEADTVVALQVARNLCTMLEEQRAQAARGELVRSPHIPGYQWIASSVGDFAVGSRLIEVKCTNKHFSSSDYRQILIYWLLSYAASVERGSPEWIDGLLMNPRLNFIVQVDFNELIAVTAAGQSKVELLEMFAMLIGDRATHWVADAHGAGWSIR
jgi:hypothetical protein